MRTEDERRKTNQRIGVTTVIIALTTVSLVERVVDQNGKLNGILVGLLVAVVRQRCALRDLQPTRVTFRAPCAWSSNPPRGRRRVTQ